MQRSKRNDPYKKVKIDWNTMVLDVDRPFPEQFEEAALVSDGALEWLDREIYQRPERLSLLTNVRFVKDSED